MKCLNCGVLFEPSNKHYLRAKKKPELIAFCNVYCHRQFNFLPLKNGRFKEGQTLGERNGMWKGDDVGYHAVHDWIKRWYGRPQVCEHCPAKDLGGKRHQWANISRKYKRERSDWIRLCASCHYKFDGRDKNFQANQQAKIRTKLSNNKSGYKNVRISQHGTYRAYISVDGKQISLGSYKTPQEAYQVYKDKALELYGTY